MARKVFLISLMMFSIMSFQMSGNSFSATTGTLDQAKQQIFALIQSGDYAGADTATNMLISDFNNSPGVDEAVHQIALKHQEVKNYQKTIDLSLWVIANWPQSKHTSWAQMDIVMSNLYLGNESVAQTEISNLISRYNNDPNLPRMLCIIGQEYKKEAFGQILKQNFGSQSPPRFQLAFLNADAMAKIESGDFDAANRTVNTMITGFSSDTNLPEVLLAIAQQFIWRHRYEQGGNICKQIVQQFPTSPYAAKAAKSASKAGQVANIASNLIDSGDYDKVVSAVGELIATFGDETDTPAAIYEIANRLETVGQFEVARQVYAQIVWRYPKGAWADMSQMGVQRTKVLAFDQIGDEASAKSTFDGVLNDFNNSPYLPSHVMWTADGYYRMACKAKEQGNSVLARKFFDKTMTTLKVVNTKFATSDEVPNALYLAGECYYQLEDYQSAADTFQKVANSYQEFQMAGDALYKVAESYQNLKKSGMVSETLADSKTVTAYEQLIKRYPKSPLAVAALHWLEKNSSK